MGNVESSSPEDDAGTGIHLVGDEVSVIQKLIYLYKTLRASLTHYIDILNLMCNDVSIN